MIWQFHFSRPVNVEVWNYTLARLQAECQQYDPFVLISGIMSAMKAETGIRIKASVVPQGERGGYYEVQGLWGRN